MRTRIPIVTCKNCLYPVSELIVRQTGRCPDCNKRMLVRGRITSIEAAKILDCSPDDLYRLANLGQVRGGHYEPKRRWYDKASVVAYRRREEKRKGKPDE